MSNVIINGIEYVPAKTVTGTRAAAEPVDVRHLDPSFRFDPDAQQHIPTLLVEFEPVSAVGGGDPKAKGWRDRDLLAMMLRGQPTAHIAPAEQPQPSAPSGWIACDERMPDAGVEVLVWLAAPAFKGSSNVAMDTWDEQHEAPVAWSSATIPVGMGWDSGTDWERITHWMPLPAAPGVAPPPSAPQAEAPSQFARGIDAAARFVEKRLADYDAAHGSTDSDTGAREYPGTGDEYVCELAEIAEAIRGLAPPPAAPEPSEAQIAAANEALYRVLFSIEAGAHKTVLELRRAAMLEALRAAAAARNSK